MIHDIRSTMAERTLKTEVQELLDLGYDHQQVFDMLVLQHPGVKPKRIARALGKKPSRIAREQYKSTLQLLMGLVLLNGALYAWDNWAERPPDLEHWWRWFTLVPFFSLFMLYGLYQWEREVFEFVGWFNLLGVLRLFGDLQALFYGQPLTMPVVSHLVSVVIGLVAVYLHRRAFLKYVVHKDPMGGPDRYEFRARGGNLADLV